MAILHHSLPQDYSNTLLSRLTDLAAKQRGARISKKTVNAQQDYIFARSEAVDVASVPAQDLSTATEPEAPALDVIDLLSPSKDINGALVKFTNSYQKVTDAFSSIFTFPYLDDFHLDLAETGTSTSKKSDSDVPPPTTRQLFIQANGNYRGFVDFELLTCRNLAAYATLTTTLLKRLTISDFYDAVSNVVDKYAQQLDQKNAEKAKTFLHVIHFAEKLNKAVFDTTTQLHSLEERIASTESQLSNLSVGTTLLKVLKGLFNLDGSDADALTKLSVLLGLGKSVLEGDFANLFKQKQALQQLLATLKRLQSQLAILRNGMIGLSTSLSESIEANDVLTEVWAGVAEKNAALVSLPEFAEKPTAVQIVKVERNWTETKKQANLAIGVLSGAIRAADTVASNAAGSAPAIFGIPKSPAEIKMVQMLQDIGAEDDVLDPKKFAVLSRLSQDADVTSRVSEKALGSMMDLQPMADAEQDAQKELEEKLGYLGPSNDVKDALDKLSGDCVAITKTFSSVLQLPNVDQLQILNPFKTQDHPEEPTNLDIRSIVLRYKTKYEELQNSSIGCIRGLIAYSSFAIATLPRVTPFTPRAGQMGLLDYLDAAQQVVAKYREEASRLSALYTKFGQDWKLAQDNLQQAINKSKEDADQARKDLEREEAKYKKQTMMGVLEIFGALVCFTIAAFTMPLVGVGAGLLYKGIKDLSGLGQIQSAIDTFKNSLKAYEATNTALTALKEPMKNVATAVTRVTKVWSDIATTLTEIEAFMATWASPSVFKLTVNQTVDAWTTVKGLCITYIGLISGSVPIK
ncbi:hypothetical protein LTR05_004263 [Lithohypha guttulata]|uniref:Uncharacterized protein n=1 Tax=Lithohypha guttulata TaxID=1690604 RepID=A0AAN7T2I8_9EURO|nr:hypothetical protein LTR05_004263 [Lithohypha guttulata]